MTSARRPRERWHRSPLARSLYALALAFTLLATPVLAVPASAASPTILLFVEGRQIIPPQPPQLIDGSTFVPLRAVAEAFDLRVTWIASSQSIAVDGPVPITLQVGIRQAMVGDRKVELVAAPQIVNGSTLVPLRALSELLGYEVTWDPALPAVRIVSKPEANLAVAGTALEMFLEQQPWHVEASYEEGLLRISGTATQGADLARLSFTAGEERYPAPLPVDGNTFTIQWPISEPGDYSFLLWKESGTAPFIDYKHAATLKARVVGPSQPPVLQGVHTQLEDLSLTAEDLTLTPLLTAHDVVELEGTLPEELNGSTVQLLCRTPCPDSDPPYIAAPVWAGKFRLPVVVDEPGPYTFALGLVQSGDWVTTLADFRLTQTAATTLSPVQTRPDSGFELLRPAVSGQEVENFIPVRGQVHRTGLVDPVVYIDILRLADDGETKLGRYRQVLPIVDGIADGRVWLKLGPGFYKVNLFLNENDQRSDNYLFAGSFTVTNRGSDELRYLAPGIGAESDNPEIIQLAAQITQEKPTTMAKVRAIHDWVAQNIAYDVEKLNNDTFTLRDGALLTLKRRMGVCQDYAYLTIALLRAQGIPARFAYGVGNGEAHAWVEAQVEGRWVTMDPTWDAGYISGDRFVFSFSTMFFDPDPAVFALDHTLEGYED